MRDPIMEEVYTARRHLWEKGGETIHGVCEYLRKREAERMARKATHTEAQRDRGTEGKPSNGQTVGRSNGDSDFAHSGAEGDAE